MPSTAGGVGTPMFSFTVGLHPGPVNDIALAIPDSAP